MSYETNLWCCLTFGRCTYNSRCDVERELNGVRKVLNDAKETITRLAFMTEPQKFYPGGNESVVELVAEELQCALDTLEEYHCKELQLLYLIDNWDNCHKDGKAIRPPEGIDIDTAYIDGDYIQ